ncbi:MAG: hypothetical protein ACOC1K_03080 [Nanoarchaeota archaeon]
MITLKKAREIAVNITNDEYDIPQVRSLHNWISKELISSVKGYEQKGKRGGRIGLYDDSLPIQIAIVAELKEIFGFQIMSEAVRGMPKLLKKKNLTIKKATEQLAKEKDLERGSLGKKYKKIKIKEHDGYQDGKNKKESSSNINQTVIDNIENWMFMNMLKASNYKEVQEAKEEMLEYISNTEKIAILVKYEFCWNKYKELLKDYYEDN